jgi:Ca2+-binding RTX toxin-like protein
VAWLAAAGVAPASTSHLGWPTFTGVKLINKNNDNRPLDMRPGHDPFDGTDPRYSCDEIHSRKSCFPGTGPVVVPANIGHNELLGGHGNDTIYAGPAGDVIWGDYNPSGQPTTQVDHLYGGPGKDFIYASHGTNVISTGGGPDMVHAHFGGGQIHCQSADVTVYLSHTSRRHYRLFGCRHISYATVGY